MCWFFKYLSLRQIAKQTEQLINLLAVIGDILPRTFDSLRKALQNGNGYAIVEDLVVMAYAECYETELFFIICSVAVQPKARGNGYGGKVVENRMAECESRNSAKPIILACANKPHLIKLYTRLGFIQQPKSEAPECIRHDRSEEEWMESDREWFIYRHSDKSVLTSV